MVTTTYLWDIAADNLLGEDNGSTASIYTQEPKVFGGVVSHSIEGESAFYHFDARGDTRAVTSSSETIIGTTLYDAWGETKNTTGVVETPFKFVGESGYSEDPAVKQHYVRARWYDGSIAKWLSHDPRGFVDGANLYVYASNTPTELVDPSGTVGVCASSFCSTTGPHGFTEGISQTNARLVLGATCDASYLKIEFRDNHSTFDKGVFAGCGTPAQEELNGMRNVGGDFELANYFDALTGKPIAPNCTYSNTWRVDVNNCWDILHVIKCPLSCEDEFCEFANCTLPDLNFVLGAWKKDFSGNAQELFKISTHFVGFEVSYDLQTVGCSPIGCSDFSAQHNWLDGPGGQIWFAPVSSFPMHRRVTQNCKANSLPRIR